MVTISDRINGIMGQP